MSPFWSTEEIMEQHKGEYSNNFNFGVNYHFNDLKTHYSFSSPLVFSSCSYAVLMSAAPPISHPSLSFFHFGEVV